MTAAVFFDKLKAGLLESLDQRTVVHGREARVFAFDFESTDRRFRDARSVREILLIESGQRPRGTTQARGEPDHRDLPNRLA
jgi:hypothetical protein